MFAKRVLSTHRDEVTADLVLHNIRNDIFSQISTIILPKVLTLLYPVQPKTLVDMICLQTVCFEYLIADYFGGVILVISPRNMGIQAI